MLTSKLDIKLYLLAMLLIIIGGLNWGSIALFGKNLVEELNNLTFNNEWFNKFIYILIAVSAIYLLFKKHTFLPFLGPTVLPTNNMKFNHTYSDLSIRVDAADASGVVYWAAKPSNVPMNNPSDAYDNYLNSGYVPVDSDGKATLFFKCPGSYKIWGWKHMPKHIHYRLIYSQGENGGLNISDIKTVDVKCKNHSD